MTHELHRLSHRMDNRLTTNRPTPWGGRSRNRIYGGRANLEGEQNSQIYGLGSDSLIPHVHQGQRAYGG